MWAAGADSNLEARYVGLDVGLGRVGVCATCSQGEDSMERGAFESKEFLAAGEEPVLYPSPARVFAPATLKYTARGSNDQDGTLAENAGSHWGK
jgi:hypothetical protein